jgi:hypothetical protein
VTHFNKHIEQVSKNQQQKLKKLGLLIQRL